MALELAHPDGQFSTDDVLLALGDRYDDAPSERTVRNCLNAMANLGVLISWGGGGRSWAHYSLPEDVEAIADYAGPGPDGYAEADGE